jgi:ankyrin repeat protein
MRVLLEAGVNPDEAGEGVLTPLMIAQMHGHRKCVELLLKYAKDKRLKP